MKNERLVVKDNALIDASFNLSLIEQRLMLLAIVEAREIPNLTSDTPVEVRAVTYREQYNTDSSEAYKQLSEASKQLFNRQFSYVDRYQQMQAVTVSRWVNEITYIKERGMVVLYLNRNVIEMITRLENQFTRYHLSQIATLSSQYSIRLYEVVIKWLSNGQTQKYSITQLRSLLGIDEHEYRTMSNFKIRVLDRAVKEINEKTNIELNYLQSKEGRTISHIKFNVKQKETELSTTSNVLSMTSKQIEMFSDRLSKSPSFQNHFAADVGVNFQTYRQEIEKKLQDTFYVKQWIDYLVEVGYSPH